MKRLFAITFSLFLAVSAFAQEKDENFRSSFIEASRLMEEFNYPVALDIWLKLIEQEPENANVNFKVGFCYLQMPNDRKKALPYLQKAIVKTTSSYDPFSPNEESAPLITYYHIARSYHIHYEIDKAIEYYNEFKSLITEKHEYYAKTDNQIEMCNNAKEAMTNPIDVKSYNLGELINTEYPEYSPVISVDESALYFTSKRLRTDSSNLYARDPNDGSFYEDIYVSYKDDEDLWGEPELLNISGSDHEATMSISADGTMLFIYRGGENGKGDIYLSTINDQGEWGEPTKMGSDINSEERETHAAVSPDGQKLYFVSDRKGSLVFPDKAHEKYESKDIYFCNKLPTGDWALAQRMSTTINTPFNEDGVFIHPDGKTMYFSSEGHKSIGGYDIFYSEMDDEGKWGKPQNLGYPVNTTDDDIFFVVSTDGKRGYFSSIQEGGFGEKDVYVLNMLGFKEKPLTLLVGQMVASDGSEIPTDLVVNVTDNETGETVGIYKPRARDKKFTIIIPPGSDYHLSYEAGEKVYFEDDIFVPENSAYQEIKKAIDLGPIDFNDPNQKMEPIDVKKETKPAEDTKTPDAAKEPVAETNTGAGAAAAAGGAAAATAGAGDTKKEEPKEVKPTSTPAAIAAKEETSFEQFFAYNQTDINFNNARFKTFVEDVVTMIKARGKVTIQVESCASKVPTTKFGTNEALTKRRAESAKKLLQQKLSDRNLGSTEAYFATMSTLVRGPEYKNDAVSNRKEYEKYQYVKVIVK